jgi:hypothetical protein
VYFDTIATPSDVSRLGAINVHFTPGARTAWHTHPHGQTIYVTEGAGLCQRRGGPSEVIRPGDVGLPWSCARAASPFGGGSPLPCGPLLERPL